MSFIPQTDTEMFFMSPEQFEELIRESRAEAACQLPTTSSSDLPSGHSSSQNLPLQAQQLSVSTSSQTFPDLVHQPNPFSTVDQVNEILKDNTYIDIFGWKDAFSNAKSAVKQVMLLGVWGDAYLATTKAGKEIVIFKGYPGLRDKLTGTRYLRDHPIVKEAGFIIGRKEMIGEALKGTRISIVCLVAWDIVHELLQDKLDMTRLGVTILSDIFQTVLATFVGTAIGFVLVFFWCTFGSNFYYWHKHRYHDIMENGTNR